MTLEMHVLAWVQTQDVARLDRLMGFQPSPLDNGISNDYTLYIKKNAQIRFHIHLSFYL
jgi:hypothetical protein